MYTVAMKLTLKTLVLGLFFNNYDIMVFKVDSNLII